MTKQIEFRLAIEEEGEESKSALLLEKFLTRIKNQVCIN